MKYLEEIQQLVKEYSKFNSDIEILHQETIKLELKKQQLDSKLMELREAEKQLIDKIKIDTGKDPDFFKIMQELKATSVL